jgi:hypothetical protein
MQYGYTQSINNYAFKTKGILDYFSIVKKNISQNVYKTVNESMILKDLRNNIISNKTNITDLEIFMDKSYLELASNDSKNRISILEKKMKFAYEDYNIIGDYEVNADIFDEEVLEFIKFSMEDED